MMKCKKSLHFTWCLDPRVPSKIQYKEQTEKNTTKICRFNFSAIEILLPGEKSKQVLIAKQFVRLDTNLIYYVV